MRRVCVPLALVAALLAPINALAWNDLGHKTVAYIAYDKLHATASNNVRARVDKLLSLHPRYNEWTQGVPAAARGREAFMRAAIWPDEIKQAAGYSNCTTPPHHNAYADTCWQPKWHYFDLPFSTDGAATRVQDPPHAYTVILDAMQTLAQTTGPANLQQSKSYKLTWLIHIVGDIHQPLHTTQRFSSGSLNGDGGGNGYAIQPFTPDQNVPGFRVYELHSFWDNVLGRRHTIADVQALAGYLSGRYRREPGTPTTDAARVQTWFLESHGVGRHYVYAIDLDRTGTADPAISQQYLRYAREVAAQRMALAGYRLADLLNEHLR